MLRVARIMGHSFVPNYLSPDSVVLDLGANRGRFARAVVQGWGCRVTAVEPVPALFEPLRDLEGVHVVHGALTGEDGPVVLHVSDDALGSSLVDGFVSTDAPVATVPGVSLTSLISQLVVDYVDLVKLDVEGAEFDVLELSPDATLRSIRQLTVEFHEFVQPGRFTARLERINARMKALGFSRIDFTRSSMDVLYLNRELGLRPRDQIALRTQKYAYGVGRRVRRRLNSERICEEY